MIPFKTSEFTITNPKTLDLEIVDKIWKWHILPVLPIRQELGIKMWPSLKSSYRPKWYEERKGRSGNSEHCFEGKGATDWTFEDFDKNVDKVVELLQKHTGYTRISVYHDRKFIHCDYKNPESDAYVYFYDDDIKNWQRWHPISRVV